MDAVADPKTLINIIWGICSAIGLALLGLIAWGIKKLVVTTFENTVQIKLLIGSMKTLSKDIDGVAKVVGTTRSKGTQTFSQGDEDED